MPLSRALSPRPTALQFCTQTLEAEPPGGAALGRPAIPSPTTQGGRGQCVLLKGLQTGCWYQPSRLPSSLPPFLKHSPTVQVPWVSTLRLLFSPGLRDVLREEGSHSPQGNPSHGTNPANPPRRLPSGEDRHKAGWVPTSSWDPEPGHTTARHPQASRWPHTGWIRAGAWGPRTHLHTHPRSWEPHYSPTTLSLSRRRLDQTTKLEQQGWGSKCGGFKKGRGQGEGSPGMRSGEPVAALQATTKQATLQWLPDNPLGFRQAKSAGLGCGLAPWL